MCINRKLFISLFAMGLAACGGGASETPTTDTGSPEVEVPVPALSGDSVIDLTAQNSDFSVFSQALAQTEWSSRLAEADSKFTLFAPTDNAFELMDAESLENLLDDQETLTELLNYHIVVDDSLDENQVSLKAQSGNSQIEMANGALAALSQSNTTLFINQSVISRDELVADNGIIYPIQQINFMPEPRVQTDQSIWDLVVARPELSTLLALLQAAELQELFASIDAELTLFAPTNDAFANMEEALLSALQNDVDALRNLLLRHTISFEISSVSLFSSNNVLLDTESGEVISISLAAFDQYPNTETDEIAYDAVFQRYVGGNGSDFPGHTLYLLGSEKGEEISQCTEQCLDTWLPLLVEDGELSRIPGFSIFERDSATQQVSYKGNPVYFFTGDLMPGQATGEGIDNLWQTLAQPQVAPSVQNASIIEKNLYATNGVLHLIDAVITEIVD